MKREIAHKACVSLLSLLLVANSLPFMNSQVKAAAGSGDGISTDARYVTFPGSGLAQVGGAINISDTIDGKTTIDGATAVINGFVAGDALTFPADTDIDGIDITDKGNGVYVLKGTADISTYENLLNSAQFSAGNTTSPHIRNISFSLGSALAFSENGHFYEFVNTGTSITWHAAQKAAEARTYFGRQGYLVTITSASENDFVKSKAQGLGWIGGKDIARPEKTSNGVTTAVGAHQKGTGDWRWVTGPEGLEDGGKGLQFYSGYYGDGGRSVYNATYGNPTTKVMYTLMDKGTEPNDTGGSEYVLHIFATGYWNDYSPTNKVTAYVVEYGGMPNDVLNVDISTTVTVIDKSVLQKKYDDITKEGLIESSYTPDSWNALNIALSEAEAVLNSASATVDEIGQAYETLAKARDGLMKNRPVPIKTSDIFYEGEQTLTIEFDKGVQIGSGTAPDAFTVTVGGKTLPVASAKVDSANPAKVTLTLEVPLSANIGEQVHVVYHGDTGYLLGKESGGTAVGDFDFDVNEDPFSQNLNITAPAENTDDRQPEINGAAPDSPDSATITVAGPDDVANKVIDGEALVINPDGSWSFDNYAADLAPGTYTVTLAATKGGRTATKTYTFTIVDKTELQSEADKATGLTETDYTSVSWNNYKDALEAAQIVLDNHNASQDEVDSATMALQAAYDALTLQPPVAESGSFTEGGNTITIVLDKGVKIGAGTAQDAFTVTIGGVKVPVDSAMVDSADPAKVILTLPAGTQLPSNQTIHVEYEGASGYLLGAEPNGSAVGDFNFDVSENPFSQSLKITAPAENTDDRQPEITGVAPDSPDSATITVAGPNGTAKVIDGETLVINPDGSWSFDNFTADLAPGVYTVTLTATKGGLTATKTHTFTIVDKTALQSEADKATGLTETDYTSVSWKNYKDALEAAQAVLDNHNASQDEVNSATTALQAAYDALTLQPPIAESGSFIEGGNTITVVLDKGVKIGAGTAQDAFTVTIGGVKVPVDSATVDSADPTKVIITLPAGTQLSADEKIHVEYDGGSGYLLGAEPNGSAVPDFNFDVVDPFAAALKITEPSGNTSDKTPAVSGSVDANADSLTVAVTDENGNTVAVPGELSWNAGDTTWSYDLKEELPPGTYTIVVTAVTGGRSVQETRTFTITEIVDKTALQTEINLAGGLDEAIYTPESWSFYQEKLEEAQIVMDKADATQAEVNTALKTLTAAREGLVTDSGHPVVNGLALDKTNPGRLVLTFDQPVKVISDELNGFNISGQRGPITVTQDVYELSEDGLQLILHLDRQIEPGEQISLTYAENLGNIIAVDSGKTLLSFNRTVTRPANTGGGTTGGSGSNGSGSSSNVPPGPTTQTIVVDVVIGGDEEAGITKVPIERTTYADGRVVDKVIYTKDKAQETVDKALQAGKNVARILIPDASDKVSEVNLQIPADTVALLQNSGIDFEIYNPNAFIRIPSASLKGLTESFYFRLVPVKNKSEREEIEARARTEEVVRKWSKDDNIQVVARPMTIETNLSSRPVTLTLPLRDVKLPEDANERAKFLKRLGIFIEHTNGGKEVVKGTAVTMPDGQLGLQFSIDHFSTFTIIDFNREISDGQHTPYVQGFPDGEFKPLENVTRGQLAAMIARNLGYVEGSWSGEAPFSDVSKTSWSAGVIAFVKERGIMHGMPDGSFRPNDAVTRAEIATVMVNYRKLAVTEGGEIGFNDIAGHWAQWNIQAVRNSGLIAGFQDGGFKPDNYASRAEAVVMVNRMFERGPLYGVATPSFEDVPAAHWAFRDIEEAATTHSYLIDGEQKEVVTE